MTDKGYIKLYRKAIKNDWLKNHKLWVFWSYCLLKATHKPYTAKVGRQMVELEPGQFVFGFNTAQEETGLTVQSIRTCIKYLKGSQQTNTQNITIKTTNKFSIITICKWEIYQKEEFTEQQADQQTNVQKSTTYNNINKNKRLKDITPENNTLKKYADKFPDAVKIVTAFIDTLDDDEQRFRPATDPQRLKWLKCSQWAINRMGSHGTEKVIDIISVFRNQEDETSADWTGWPQQFKSILKLQTKNKQQIYYIDFFYDKIKERCSYGS